MEDGRGGNGGGADGLEWLEASGVVVGVSAEDREEGRR